MRLTRLTRHRLKKLYPDFRIDTVPTGRNGNNYRVTHVPTGIEASGLIRNLPTAEFVIKWYPDGFEPVDHDTARERYFEHDKR
jgi:hypothetical protein